MISLHMLQPKSFLVLRFLVLSIALVLAPTLSWSQTLKLPNFEVLSSEGESFDEMESFGFSADEVPSQFSLENYALVADQEGGSCVGHAVCGALNVMHNYFNDIEDYDTKFVHKFDPYYVYCALKDPDDLNCVGCECGALIMDAVNLVTTYGAKKSAIAPNLECGNQLSKRNLTDLATATTAYEVDKWYNLFEYQKDDEGEWEVIADVETFKWALANFYPIVTGINVADDFAEVVGDGAIYTAADDANEGHAVTIIGYDDNYGGGSFKILNSYGDEWGDDGFFWMSYADYFTSAFEAYVFSNENWEGWNLQTPYYGKSFYRGFNEDGDCFWEGPTDEEGYFQGRGAEMTERHVAVGSYAKGSRDGWWLILEWPGLEDSWRGFVLFDQGEVLESESFGFSGTDNSKEALMSTLELDVYGVEVNENEATPEEISTTPEIGKVPK